MDIFSANFYVIFSDREFDRKKKWLKKTKNFWSEILSPSYVDLSTFFDPKIPEQTKSILSNLTKRNSAADSRKSYTYVLRWVHYCLVRRVWIMIGETFVKLFHKYYSVLWMYFYVNVCVENHRYIWGGGGHDMMSALDLTWCYSREDVQIRDASGYYVPTISNGSHGKDVGYSRNAHVPDHLTTIDSNGPGSDTKAHLKPQKHLRARYRWWTPAMVASAVHQWLWETISLRIQRLTHGMWLSFSKDGTPKARTGTDSWVQRHILPILPAVTLRNAYRCWKEASGITAVRGNLVKSSYPSELVLIYSVS